MKWWLFLYKRFGSTSLGSWFFCSFAWEWSKMEIFFKRPRVALESSHEEGLERTVRYASCYHSWIQLMLMLPAVSASRARGSSLAQVGTSPWRRSHKAFLMVKPISASQRKTITPLAQETFLDISPSDSEEGKCSVQVESPVWRVDRVTFKFPDSSANSCWWHVACMVFNALPFVSTTQFNCCAWWQWAAFSAFTQGLISPAYVLWYRGSAGVSLPCTKHHLVYPRRSRHRDSEMCVLFTWSSYSI